MAYFVRVNSTLYEDLNRRIIKVLRLGSSDWLTANDASPFGIDSNPVKDWVAVYSETAEKGEPVIVGYLNPNQLAEPGDTRLFSTDDLGNLKFYVWLRNDGSLSLGGEGDNLVRFSKLKDTIDELQNDIAELKKAFTNWVVVAEDGGAALKAISTEWAGTPLQKPIDPAKINEIKTL